MTHRNHNASVQACCWQLAATMKPQDHLTTRMPSAHQKHGSQIALTLGAGYSPVLLCSTPATHVMCLLADLWSQLTLVCVPACRVCSNHEIEIANGLLFTAYNARYPQPQQAGSFKLNFSAVPANINGSDNNLYSAAEIPGVATVVG